MQQLKDSNDLQDFLFLFRRAGGELFHDLAVDGIRGFERILIFQNIVYGQPKGIADGNQSGKGYLDPVVFDIADMRYIDADLIGDVFLGVMALQAAGADVLSDLFKIEFFHGFS